MGYSNFEGVYFFYKDSREGSFLEGMLKGFSGVVISDFFHAMIPLSAFSKSALFIYCVI